MSSAELIEATQARKEPPWQYFSKTRWKWIDAGPGDCKESLLKWNYLIRDRPQNDPT